jgi:hypothetical protein
LILPLQKNGSHILIQGVNDWQVAFEKAGFKNAIFGKMAPTKEEDSTWSLKMPATQQ